MRGVDPDGWTLPLTEPNAEVVTVDVLNMNARRMQQEVLQLRVRVQKLTALLRVLLVVFRMSGYALNLARLSNGSHKWALLRAIDRSRSALPLRSNTRLPHSAFRGQTPDEMYFSTGNNVPDELEAARQARAETNRKRTCSVCELVTVSVN